MTNKAAKLEALRNKAIEATQLAQQLKLQDDLRREARLEEQRQEKVREANEKIRLEEIREKKMREEDLKEERIKAERARQDMIPLYPNTIPAARKDTYVPTPLIPPAPRSHSTDSSTHHSRDRQPSKTRHVGRQQRLRENLTPASAYNSALPGFQVKKPKSQSPKRSSSGLPYAYDGVTSVLSTQPPAPSAIGDTRRPPEMEGRRKPSRKVKPPMHRQDSDQPLKSAMRAPGDRKPRRKATITEKPPTTRLITDPRIYESYDSESQSDWLPKPPVISKMRAPRQTSASETSSRGESVYLPVPHPKDRPIIKKGGLAPAPPPRAKIKSRVASDVRPPAGRQETTSGAAGVGAGAAAGAGSVDQGGWGQWLGWKGTEGIGNVNVTLPSQSKALKSVLPGRREDQVPRPTIDRAASSSMSDPHQPGKRWANRLRERK